jgi:predicted DNA-binding transcriptional regulator AlpA
MSDRVRLDFVCEITGMQRRHAQQMAKKGQIPSAARYGRLWTFNRQIVTEWAAEKERATWQTRTFIDAARSGGVGFSPTTKSYAKAYEQHVRTKRSRGSQTGRSA